MTHATIQVTADHIAHGKPRTHTECPIALAIKEQWPGDVPPRAVFVTDHWATVATSDDAYLRCRLPESAEAFIDVLDRGQAVKPFQFDADWEA